MSESYDVAVIGLGAMGAATLYQIAKRGLGVIGIDRHAPPHVHGSTHGETRITRIAVGEGAAYVPLVRRSHAIWRELEAATGERLLVECGGVVIGRLERDAAFHGAPGFLRATIDVAERFGIPHELLDRNALAGRFPQFVGLAPDEIGFHEPGAGYVHPEACVRAQLAEAIRHGAAIRTGVEVRRVDQTDAAITIATDAGPIRAARAVVAAGAWTAALMGEPFDRLLTVTRQSLYWFALEDGAFAAAPSPVYIREHGPGEDDVFYGFPPVAGARAVKVATERFEDRVDPGSYRGGAAAPDAAVFHARHIAGRLGGVTPTLIDSASCLYTSTIDGRFVIDAHPAMPRVLVISACSGHGFKHSAAIGELVAEHVRSAAALAPFTLGA